MFLRCPVGRSLKNRNQIILFIANLNNVISQFTIQRNLFCFGNQHTGSCGLHVADGRIDSHRDLVMGIHGRRKNEICHGKNRSAMNDVGSVQMEIPYFHSCLGISGFHHQQLDAGMFGKVILLLKKTFRFFQSCSASNR